MFFKFLLFTSNRAEVPSKKIQKTLMQTVRDFPMLKLHFFRISQHAAVALFYCLLENLESP